MNQKILEAPRKSRRVAAALAIAGLSIPLAWALGQQTPSQPTSVPVAPAGAVAIAANRPEADPASPDPGEAASRAELLPISEPWGREGRPEFVLTGMRQFGGGEGSTPTIPPPIVMLPHGDDRSAATWDLLQKDAEVNFDSVPLKEAIQFLMQAAAGEGNPPLDYYLDPLGLRDADKTGDESVALHFRKVPIKMTLRLALRENGLIFVIRDGLVIITNEYPEHNFWPGETEASPLPPGGPPKNSN